ncbi:hypothetical protein PGQ11_000104 [Apiospora arundinis]
MLDLKLQRKRAQGESRKMPFKPASRELSDERCNRHKRTRRLTQECEQRYVLFRVDAKQDGRETPIWTGEKELLQLLDRLGAARSETKTILKRVHATMKKWLGLVVQIKELDLPRGAREKDVESEGSQTGSLGDVAEGMVTSINEVIDSWTVHDYQLECFRAIVEKGIDRKAFEHKLAVPQAIQLLVARIPKTWEVLDAYEKLVDDLAVAMMKPAKTNVSWAAVNKPQSDTRVSKVTLALEQLKSALSELVSMGEWM